MSSELGSSHSETVVENLPRPGAMPWGYSWMPTLDGERIPVRHEDRFGMSGFDSREEAWAEAIKWVKACAGLAFEIELGVGSGCLLNKETVVVETVTGAREAIAHHVRSVARGDDRETVSLSWEDLAEYEDSRRYDPNDSEAAMTSSYSPTEDDVVEGSDGTLHRVTYYVWATASPAVWDHPADSACGVDNDDKTDDDL